MNTANIVRILFVFVGISGAFSVLFGAWLAHAGQSLELSVQTRLASALQYQFIHTLALLMILLAYQWQKCRVLLISGIFFTAGILFFSVSLYLKTFLSLAFIGKFAPIGGICFALGWAVFIYIGSKKHD